MIEIHFCYVATYIIFRSGTNFTSCVSAGCVPSHGCFLVFLKTGTPHLPYYKIFIESAPPTSTAARKVDALIIY